MKSACQRGINMGAYRLYFLITKLCSPLVYLYLRYRQIRGKEDRLRFKERFGYASKARPVGTLWWLHAASIGEAVSLLTLISEIQKQDANVHLLLTTGTVTSAALLEHKLPAGVMHQYMPVDLPNACKHFLAHWQPEKVIFTESEIWPNMLMQASKRGCILALVNARMSEKSFAHWQYMPGFIRLLLSTFSLIAPQSEQDAARFTKLGATHVKQLGHLKHDSTPLPANAVEVTQWQDVLGNRPCIVAASFHPGEDEVIAAAQQRLLKHVPNLLLILAPRHPQRANGMIQTLKAHQLTYLQRSEISKLPDAQINCYVADTIGELGLWYRLANIVIMGGSFVPHGGQNPLEAIRLDNAVLIGPHTHNFATIVEELKEQHAIIQLADVHSETLTNALQDLLQDEAKQHALKKASNAWLAGAKPVAQVVARELMELCP